MSEIPSNAYALIIGAMKSGTTSLYSYMVKHPQICECVTKEPEYFSRSQSPGAQEISYGELWKFEGSIHRYVLDGSTGYTKYPMRKGVPERISRSGIDPLFIYILRDPIERIESHYNAARFNPDWKYSLMDDHLINTSNYFMQLERYRKYFPKEKFLLLDFNQLKTDPRQVLLKVYDYLGIDKGFAPESFERENTTRVRNMWEIVYERLVRAAGINRCVPESLKRAGRKISSGTKPLKKVSLTEEEKEIIFHLLREDMLKLKSGYGVDTGKWGFI